MIGAPLHLARAAGFPDASGAQAYADDMHRIVAVLGTSPYVFPWGVAALLLLGLLAWCAALTAAWIHLNRRFERRQMRDLMAKSASAETASPPAVGHAS